MEKTMTDAKRVTELEKRKKQLEKSTSKGYFIFLIAMLAVALQKNKKQIENRTEK